MPQAKLVGDRVGPYLLTGVLGEGGAGQVFRAKWDPRDEDDVADTPDNHPPEVAIKLLRAAHAGSEAIFHRFVREIGLAQRIHHPHIVQHLDSGLAEDFLYYAMELVPYGSLREVVQKRGALPWRDAVESATHIADALACLHDAGVVHRDLKPDNVFLSETGGLKLGDFGLAKTKDSPQLTLAGQTVGSVRYMAPEQVKGQRDLDGRVDLYALGCVLTEMCTGTPPFESVDPMVVFYKHVEEPPPKLRTRTPSVPASLEELADLLLEKDRNDRPPSAHGVRAALEAIHVSEAGEIDNLDELLEGDVAEIEIAPEEPDDEQEASLAGLSTSSTSGGLTLDALDGGSNEGSDHEFGSEFDEEAEQEYDARLDAEDSPPVLRENKSDLSERLAGGAAEVPKTNNIGLIVAVLLVIVGLVVAAVAINNDGGPTDDAPVSLSLRPTGVDHGLRISSTTSPSSINSPVGVKPSLAYSAAAPLFEGLCMVRSGVAPSAQISSMASRMAASP